MTTARLREAWQALVGLLALAVVARVVVWILTPLVPYLISAIGLGIVASLLVGGPRFWHRGGR